MNDDEEGDKLTIDELSAMHQELLQQASSTLEETSDAVNLLKQEQQQAAIGMRAVVGDALEPAPARRVGCCPAPCVRLSTRCTIS